MFPEMIVAWSENYTTPWNQNCEVAYYMALYQEKDVIVIDELDVLGHGETNTCRAYIVRG
jgi:hypothetical protein